MTSERTVLVVEDDHSVRQFVCRTLASGGYETQQAQDAEEALQLLSQESRRFDLLVTDVRMPGIDGLTLAEAVTSKSPTTKVLVMTGHAGSSREIREKLESDRFPFLLKPFTRAQLFQGVNTVLEPAADGGSD